MNTEHFSMIRRAVIISLLLVVGGCASPRDTASALVEESGWQWNTITAGTFDLAVARAPERRGNTLWVYIEGDGLAYVTPDTPSTDPTPTDPVALRLALTYPSSLPVAYLARPCQYVAGYSKNCDQQYWTNARYAPEVIADTNLAIDLLKRQSGTSQVVLVGYSGGGAVAVLAASQRHDVVGIITVAADLDTAYWTKRDELSPLLGSLNPADIAIKVADIPQIHFTGARDENVGTDVVQSFVKHLPPTAQVRIKEVPGFTHTCCWADQWSLLIANAGTP